MDAPRRAQAGAQAPPLTLPPTCGHDHLVEFYETDEFLTTTVATFVTPALRAEDAAVIVATPEHRAAFLDALSSEWLDPAALIAAGRLIVLDAEETLACFMKDGHPDPAGFRDTIGPVLDRAGADGTREIRVYGEMVALLWGEGNVPAAIALEDLWNDLALHRRFELLCAYPMSTFDGAEHAEAFRRVCEQHTSVIPAETFTLLPDEDARQRLVARMQQEATALRGELDRLRDDRAALAELAYLDPLTSLANRRAFDRDLEREWALALRDGIDSYVVTADLDGFKRINDRYGHAAGDQLLRRFARALTQVARDTDVVARTGGDEFGVLMIRCDEQACQAFLARLNTITATILGPDDKQLRASVGHASLQRAPTAADALERADLAMYARKRRRRGPFSARRPG